MARKSKRVQRLLSKTPISVERDQNGQHCDFQVPFIAMMWGDDCDADDVLEIVEETVANLQEMPFFIEDHALIDYDLEHPSEITARNKILDHFRKTGEFKI